MSEPRFVKDEATGQSRAVIKSDEQLAEETEAAKEKPAEDAAEKTPEKPQRRGR